MSVIKYTENGISGNTEHLNGDSAIVEIEFAPRFCKYEDRSKKYDDICRYLEQFANGKKVLTTNVVVDIATEADTDGIMYVQRVALQVTIN